MGAKSSSCGIAAQDLVAGASLNVDGDRLVGILACEDRGKDVRQCSRCERGVGLLDLRSGPPAPFAQEQQLLRATAVQADRGVSHPGHEEALLLLVALAAPREA